MAVFVHLYIYTFQGKSPNAQCWVRVWGLFPSYSVWRRKAQKTKELGITEIEAIQEEQEMKSWLMQEQLASFSVVFRI